MLQSDLFFFFFFALYAFGHMLGNKNTKMKKTWPLSSNSLEYSRKDQYLKEYSNKKFEGLMVYVCIRLNSYIKKKGMVTSSCDIREVFIGTVIFYKSLRKSVGIHIVENW